MSTVLGDRHMGHGTERIEREGGAVIRKYRSAATERAYSVFLEELSALGCPDLPGRVTVLRETDSFHEQAVVEHLPAVSEAALHACFRKEGTLLFLTYLLGSVDMHAENLIVCGDTPVLVDLETLLTGLPARTAIASGTLTDSVMRSHLLPNFIGCEDCSGLSGTTAALTNLPLYQGQPVFPWQYLPSVQEGFHAAYTLALEKRAAFDALLSVFDDCCFRQLLRPTQTYGKLLTFLSRLPAEERSGVARTLLSRAYHRDCDTARAAQTALVLQAECDALLQEDIPLFYVRGNGVDLLCNGSCVLPGHLALSPVAFAKARLAALCPADEDKQLRLLRLSTAAVTPLAQAPAARSGVLSRLEDAAVPGLSSGWTMLDTDKQGTVYYQSIGNGLYDGLCGILCCYAALAPQQLAKYYAPYRQQVIVKDTPIALTDRSCGLQSGLGGQLSALLHISELTGDVRYRDDAHVLARHLLPQVSGALSAECMNGAGGLALCLPRLDNAIARPLALALAPHLLRAEPTLTGVAHGAAGTALALGALQAVLGDGRFDERILYLLQWEDAFFDADAGNWFDLRRPEAKGFMSGWCSGAPGIGMARQQLLSYTKAPQTLAVCRQDIARSIAFLRRQTPTKRDCLCCGSAARLMAASRLGLPLTALPEDSAPRLLHLLNTADSNCGLMQGLAGIGYALGTRGNPLSGGMLV